MERDQILAVLREHADELRRRGVLHAALFGSLARDDARPNSDIDVMVDIDPERHIGVYGFAGIGCFLEDVFSRRVDVAKRSSIVQRLGIAVEREAVSTF
jgi:predicted nucleotidyltransferase